MSMTRRSAARAFVGVGRRWMATEPAPPRTETKQGWWKDVVVAPRDQTLGVTDLYNASTNPAKVNLGVGTYRDDEGNTVVLNCVREAERRLAGKTNMEYLPMSGSSKFTELALKLAYGDDSEMIKEKRVAAIHTLSGTGACRLMAEYHRKYEPKIYMYIPYPTWPNHHNIWKDAQVRSQTYRYYDSETKGLAFSGFLADLKQAPDGSYFLMHACAHNPTGVDPTLEQWQELSDVFKAKGHFPFFDLAYQGIASGDFDRDAQAVRLFVKDGHQVGLAQSFAKNMGLYGQRVGCLSLITDNEKQANAVRSQFQQILRPIYSSPPSYGAEIATTIMDDPELKSQWYGEVKVMADRMINMRFALREKIEALGSTLNWQHLTDQIGMFCYTGLTQQQIERLTSEHHIFLTKNGRISMAGVNSGNIDYLANAIHDVTSREIAVPPPSETDARPTPSVPPRRRIKWSGGDWRRS